LERLPQQAGVKKKLSDAHRKWLARQVKTVPDLTLEELQEQLGKEEKIQVSQATVCRELQALRLPRKKSRSQRQREIPASERGFGAR
jgi:transposase